VTDIVSNKVAAKHGNDAVLPSGIETSLSSGRWYALTIIILIYSCHFLDRAVLSLVAEPVRREFGLSDSQLGMLNGFAFGLMFAVAGIPIGLLVDRVNRRNLLAGMVLLWSSATAACGLAGSYTALLLGRMAVGAAEAGGAPTSLSLLSDYFPPRQRTSAVGLYYVGNAVGGLMCVIVGTYFAAHYGWRSALLVAGVPGVTLALVAFFTLREPGRGATEAGSAHVGNERPTGLRMALREIVANPTLLCLFGAAPLASAAVASAGAWLPPFLMRSHGMNVAEASLVLGIAGGGFGALGSALGGGIADRIARNIPARRAAFGACVLLLAIPAFLGAVLSATKGPTIALTFISFGLVFPAIVVAFGSMLTLVTSRMRGITSASMQVVTNLFGYGLGPLSVGILSDRIGGADSLRYAISIVSTVCCLGGAVCFLLARKFMRRGSHR
jgi:predicted MFS family arabinose efflux permease